MLERNMHRAKRHSKSGCPDERLLRLLNAAEAVLDVYEEKGRLDFSTEQELEAAIEVAHQHAGTCRKQKTT